jgi:hypothetical protein
MAAQDLRKLYDQVLYVWSCRNAQLLREGRYAEADESQLKRLILHRLKYHISHPGAAEAGACSS